MALEASDPCLCFRVRDGNPSYSECWLGSEVGTRLPFLVSSCVLLSKPPQWLRKAVRELLWGQFTLPRGRPPGPRAGASPECCCSQPLAWTALPPSLCHSQVFLSPLGAEPGCRFLVLGLPSDWESSRGEGMSLLVELKGVSPGCRNVWVSPEGFRCASLCSAWVLAHGKGRSCPGGCRVLCDGCNVLPSTACSRVCTPAVRVCAPLGKWRAAGRPASQGEQSLSPGAAMVRSPGVCCFAEGPGGDDEQGLAEDGRDLGACGFRVRGGQGMRVHGGTAGCPALCPPGPSACG